VLIHDTVDFGRYRRFGELSVSALSAEVEFQVDVFEVPRQKNLLFQNLHSFIYNRHRFPKSAVD